MRSIPQVATQLFGIGREALANVMKHSQRLDRVDPHRGRPVTASWSRSATTGSGSTRPPAHPGHFGLDSMRSRAAEIGGQLTIASTPGRGTVVRVEVPANGDGVPSGA